MSDKIQGGEGQYVGDDKEEVNELPAFEEVVDEEDESQFCKPDQK